MIRKINNIKYFNLIYLKLNFKFNILKLINFSFKLLFFFKINNFLKKNNFKKKKFFKIIFIYYYFIWYFFLNLKNLNIFFFLLKNTIEKYKNLFIFQNDELFVKNYLFFPINFFNLKNLNYFFKININSFFFNNLNLFFLKNNLKKNNFFFNNIKKNFNFHFFSKKINFNFLKTQRRYNKRRYSKVRITSRPPFFAGISLSSIFLGLLWDGSIKGVDWLSSWIIKIDINLFFFLIFLYFLFRLWKIYYLKFLIRKKNKIKILNNIKNIFTLKFFYNFSL